MQDEWERVERSKQPLLEITPLTGTADELIDDRRGSAIPDHKNNLAHSLSLPWSEEESKVGRMGYDGELT